MKNKFLRIICLLLLCCTFGLSGCLNTSMSPNIEGDLPDDVLDATTNAEDILNTKDNVTYYYNSLEELQADIGKDANERNNLRHTFGDAYVFVDPGSEHKFIDHFTQANPSEEELEDDIGYTFPQLVRRQVDLLADLIYTAINKIYIDGTIFNETDSTNDAGIIGKFHKFQLKNGDDPIEGGSLTTNLVNVLNTKIDTSKEYNDYIYLDDIYTYLVMSGIDSNDNYGINKTITILDDPATEAVESGEKTIKQNLLKTQYAIYGGNKLVADNFNSGGATYTYKTFTDAVNDETTWWKIAGTNYNVTAVQAKLLNELRLNIASSLAGVETPNWDDENQYKQLLNEIIKKIDHLGYTNTDKLNLKNSILNNIIGKDVLDRDKENLQILKDHFEVGDDNIIDLNNTLSSGNSCLEEIKKVFFNETEQPIDLGDGQYYKAYQIIIDAIVEQALTCTVSNAEKFTNETCFPGFPRMQIIKVDSFDLMDQQVDGIEDNENVDPDDINIEDLPSPEDIKFEEKFSKYEKILGVLLLPKQVYGERTMAIKQNGEWVKDEDGKVKLKTENVEGFILSGTELVLISEEDNMTTLKTDFQVHTSTKDMRASSDFAEVGYVKPDASEQTSYISTEIIDVNKQDLIQKEETDVIIDDTTLSEYRIQGYNGLDIVENGSSAYIVIDKVGEGEDEVRVSLQAQKVDDYMVYNKMSTIMYKFITITDINGTDGTTFAGYKLNVDDFAGDNFVLANFPIYAVNDDEEVRESKLNILYFYLDCI